MFEYIVRPHVCLSVSPSTHKKHVTCMNVAFYFKFGFGWEGCGFLKFSFVGEWGWFYFEFLGDYFLLRGFFIKLLFSLLLCGGSLLIFV